MTTVRMAVLVAAVVASGGLARAQAQPASLRAHVVVVRAASASAIAREAATRLAAELAARGFPTREGRSPPGVDRRAEVAAAAAAPDVLAAFALWDNGADEIEIWAFDVVTRQTTVLPVTLRPGTATNPALVVAVRAVELLRATLLEVASRRAPPATTPSPATTPLPATTPSPATTRPAAAPSPPATSSPAARGEIVVGLGGGALRGEGASTAFAPVLSLGYGSGRFAVRTSLFGLGSAVKIEGAAGSAALTPTLGLVELALRFGHRTLVPHLAVGGGAQHLRVEGDARPPHEARSRRTWTFLATAGAGLTFFMKPRLAVVLDARFVAAATTPRLRLHEEITEPLGRKAIYASLGVAGGF